MYEYIIIYYTHRRGVDTHIQFGILDYYYFLLPV